MVPFPHLGGLHFVPRDARPASQVRKHSALLPFHAWLHLTPPLVTHDGGCRKYDKTERPFFSFINESSEYESNVGELVRQWQKKKNVPIMCVCCTLTKYIIFIRLLKADVCLTCRYMTSPFGSYWPFSSVAVELLWEQCCGQR